MSETRSTRVPPPPTDSARRDVAQLSDVAIEPSVEGAVEAVREFLGMELAYAAEFVDGQQQFRVLSGDGDSFGIYEGLTVPLDQTYCQRVLAGRLPNVMPDVRADDRAAALLVTQAANVGAFMSVPITLADGTLYGTLCAGSHDAQPSLGYRDLQFLYVFARIVADQIERQRLHEQARAMEAQATAASTLLAALAARDGYTAAHSQAVLELALSVAGQMGLDEAALEQLRHAALLHDVGKIAIPDAILHKPGALSPEEREVMRTHPLVSERIVSAAGLADLGPVLRAEHEHWDGTGYPDGLTGHQIPVASRITFVCDAYHAMTSDRPYRPALSEAAACDEIASGIGTQFCPDSAHALIAVLTGPSYAATAL